MKFEGDIIIADPIYLCKQRDWEKSGYGYNMEALGIYHYLCRDIMPYETRLNEVRNTNSEQKIGTFDTYTGMIGVFLEEEILQYNPQLNLESKEIVLIKDFSGEIMFETEENVTIIGNGNINFASKSIHV